jgi:hypothetical protein
VVQKLFGPDWCVRTLRAEGDCFYLGIQHGLTSEYSVTALRSIVADSLNDNTWEFYQNIKDCSPDYAWVNSCATKEAAKELIVMDVSSAKRAKKNVVWADDFAVQTISNVLKLVICVCNHEAKRESSKYLVISPEVIEGQSSDISFLDYEVVVLQRTRRSHYNLIEYSPSQSCSLVGRLTVQSMPPTVRNKFFPEKVEDAVLSNVAVKRGCADNGDRDAKRRR